MADTHETISEESPAGLDDKNRRGSSHRFPVVAKDDFTTLSHYYRGEMARMMSWRDRLDRTTNWAIGAVAAMLSITLSTSNAHHVVLIFSMVMSSFFCRSSRVAIASPPLPDPRTPAGTQLLQSFFRSRTFTRDRRMVR